METPRALPAPWLGRTPEIDVEALLRQLEAEEPTPDRRDLALVLRYAAGRLADAESKILFAQLPDFLLRAQLVLDIAVEWRIPAVERWAVAWLEATGRPYLRTRWSSRSRDGRERRDRRTRAGDVTAVARYGTGAVFGTVRGVVASWTSDGEIRTLAHMPEDVQVLALASDGDRVVAVGEHCAVTTAGWADGPSSPERRANLVAVAVADGVVGCGDEEGTIRRWQTGSGWSEPVVGYGTGRVIAVTIRSGAVIAVWADGLVAALDANGTGWAPQIPLGGPVSAAAWDDQGERLAYVRSGEKVVRVDGEPVRQHPGARLLAWSADGRLASNGQSHRIAIGPPDGPYDLLSTEERTDAIVFIGRSSLVTAHRDHLVQWDLTLSGSDDPTLVDDPVEAIGVSDADPGGAVVGTASGRLIVHRGDGASMGDEAKVPSIKGLVPYGAGWLIATMAGAYEWVPGGRLRQLSSVPCNSVTVRRGRALYGRGSDVRDADGSRLTRMPATVARLRAAPDGTLAVQDVAGHLRIITMDGRRTDVAVGAEELVTAFPGGALTIRRPTETEPATRIREWPGPRPAVRLSAEPEQLVAWGDGELVGAYARGTAVIRPGPDGVIVVAASLSASRNVAARGSHLVAADGIRRTGYELRRPGPGSGDGRVSVTASADGAECQVRVADGDPVQLDPTIVRDLRERADQDTLQGQSEAADLAGVLGDALWSAGLGREIDRARGDDPERPVRLELGFADGAPDWLADLPWELLHRRWAPLMWFADPPVTLVRVVPHGSAPRPATATPSLLVMRDSDDALKPVGEAYEEIRRRTRSTTIRLVHGTPVRYPDAARADLVHLWAHATPVGVEIDETLHSNETVADTLAAQGARFVVLVGCSSATLARLLVTRGVEAVVGMRAKVYNRTVVPLVEGLTTAVVRGEPVDQAFAAALRQYVLTGQPGAAAVPVLYLRAGSSGVIFGGGRTQ
ncbi:CHAT domain-containing protein [Actinoplanes bogorensis]|uniref:CHAT domain-containing protein n=1 Tax=Paractinoplanes bogorensis TaxID=1610840 RepID=A0ABS5YST2_9ACTN|nr:CHAT domain-containing protein [Actinoplanes bogorensis]MBU2666376.1 CHAT domain-containing protein [Actinoplanes bogorensis]